MATSDRQGPKGPSSKGRPGPRGGKDAGKGPRRDAKGRDGPRRDTQGRDGKARDGKARDGKARDGKARDGKPGAGEGEEPRPRLGEARNEHGTRTARRVRCTRCGKVDHVPGGPRDKGKVMCRACLEEVMELFEVGVREKKKTKPADCTVCGKHFDLPLSIDVDDEEIVCFDCMRGFTTWQGAVNRPETRGGELGEARRPGVRLRKKTPADD
jgi:hypothetical protein